MYKSHLFNPSFVEKRNYFILFFLQSYFFDEQSKFLNLQFYSNRKFKHLRTKVKRSLSAIGVNFHRRKEKKLGVSKVL